MWQCSRILPSHSRNQASLHPLYLRVKEIKFIDKSWELFLEISNKRLNNYLVEKASVSVNGVSLTISKISKKYFILNIIPHTLKLTNLKHLRKNDLVNVELDIFGKYIYKYTN